MTVTIQKAEDKYLDEILDLSIKFYHIASDAKMLDLYPEKARENLHNFINHDNFSIFIALKKNKIIGLIMGVLSDVWYSKDIIGQEILWFVDENHRGKVGLKLKKVLEKDMQEKGATVINMVSLFNGMDISSILIKNNYFPVETSFMKRV